MRTGSVFTDQGGKSQRISKSAKGNFTIFKDQP